MFLFQPASKISAVQSMSAKALQNFKQIFTVPKLTEEERWNLYYDYSAVTEKATTR